MGHTESTQERELVRDRDPRQWTVLYSQRDCQIWQCKDTKKKYMAYPINLSQTDSEQNLQMYHFRKLNHHQFVTPEVILKNKNESLCSGSNTVYLLLEFIVVRLGDLNRLLSFEDRLTVLAGIFRGLQTLNFVYGPLFLSEDMVGFNEHGQTKMWVNELFSCNQPSPFAKTPLGEASNGYLSLSRTSTAQQAMHNCVTEVFRVVGNWQVGTYPPDFRQEAAKVKTFSEGQQFIISYCRRKGIELAETVPFWNYVQNRQNRSKSYDESFTYKQPLLLSERSSQQSINRNKGARFFEGSSRHERLVSLEESVVRQHFSGNPPPPPLKFQPRNSSASQRIRISYGFNSNRPMTDTQQPLTHELKLHNYLPPPPVPIQLVNSTHHRIQTNPLETRNSFTLEKEQIPIFPVETAISEEMLGGGMDKREAENKRPQVVEISFKNIEDTSSLFVKQKSPREVLQVVNQSPTRVEQQSKQKIFSPQKVSNQQFSQQTSLLPKISEQSPLHMMKSTHSDNASVNIIDDISKWQASMLMKLSTKKTTPNEVQQLKVSESVEQLPHKQPKTDMSNIHSVQDMQAYVRQKYGEYITAPKEEENKSTKKVPSSGSFGYHHQPYSFGPHPSDHKKESKYLPTFKESKPSDLFLNFKKDHSTRQRKPSCQYRVEELIDVKCYETNKYTTFGKIEPNPLPSSAQFNVFQSNTQYPAESSTRKPAKSSYTKIDEKYNKYVLNKVKRDPFPSKNTSNSASLNTSFHTKKEKLKTYVDYIRESPASSSKDHVLRTPEREAERRVNSYDSQKGKVTYDRLKELLRK